jgi:hypothetical protein
MFSPFTWRRGVPWRDGERGVVLSVPLMVLDRPH